MILTVDMGNTHIEIGAFEDDEMLFSERMATDLNKTSLEYAVLIHAIFEILHMDRSKVTGAIISSVVPPLTDIMKKAVKKVTGIEALIVGPGVKNGLKIAIDDPKQLGADLVVGAVGAIREYGAPLIVIDMGTATTMSVIDDKKTFRGGPLLPGMRTASDALASGASLLPKISFRAPEKVIGTNTMDCMQGGAIYGQAAQIDGLIDRIEDELGMKTTHVATGGLSGIVIPHCRHEIIFDSELMLKGLKVIYAMNLDKKKK